jgi:hypothetical protein
MANTQQPFFIRGIRAGLVDTIESQSGFSRGVLHLDDCPERPIFAAIVSLARDVDTAPPNEYQARWEIWNRGCAELQDLHLWIGDGQSQIEEFSIESDWSIEWCEMDDGWTD